MCSQTRRPKVTSPVVTVPGLLARLLPTFDHDAREHLARTASLCHVHHGEILVHAGEVTPTLGHLIEGTLGMVRAMPQGKPQLMGLLLPGDVFGQIFDGPMPHAIQALTDAVVLSIDRQDYEAALGSMPMAEQALIVSMIDDLDAARAWILILSSARAVERVAAFLEILVQRQHVPGSANPTASVTLRLPLGRKDLARCLGIRPESLSRAIHSLANDGIIEIVTVDIFRIPDPAALVAASAGAFEIAERPKEHQGAKAY